MAALGGFIGHCGTVALNFNWTPEDFSAFGYVEPIQVLARESQIGNPSVFRRVQDLSHAPIGLADLNAERSCEVDLTDGIFSHAINATHPSCFRHLEPVKRFAVYQRAVWSDLKRPAKSGLCIRNDQHGLVG